MALMDSPHATRPTHTRRDREGERAEQAQTARVSTKPLVSLTAKVTPAQLEEFKRRVAPKKATPAITEMVLAFLGEGSSGADGE